MVTEPFIKIADLSFGRCHYRNTLALAAFLVEDGYGMVAPAVSGHGGLSGPILRQAQDEDVRYEGRA